MVTGFLQSAVGRYLRARNYWKKDWRGDLILQEAERRKVAEADMYPYGDSPSCMGCGFTTTSRRAMSDHYADGTCRRRQIEQGGAKSR